MKLNEKDKKRKQKLKDKIVKTKKEQVAVVAQEIKFARLLSGNENKVRERVIKTLKKWLQNCFHRGYEFKEDDFTRVWKGIFYAMWMSDKPLVQEDLAENIAGILDHFPPEHLHHAMLMTKAGFKVLATEWFGIDQHRIDKFLMLARRYLRGSIRCLQRCEWSVDSCKKYAEMLTDADGLLSMKTPHYARNAISLILHFIDCFLEELAKVSKGKVPEDSMVELLRPFCEYTAQGEVPALTEASQRLLMALLRQSKEGIMYAEATRAWKQMGCPKGGPDALELVVEDESMNNEDSDDDEDTGALDPRAGGVSVWLRTLAVPGAALAGLLRALLARTRVAAQGRVRVCMRKFEKYARGQYPLKMSARDTDVPKLSPRLPTARAVAKLQKVERMSVAASDDLALRGLSRKHRKRLLAKSRAGISIVDDVQNLKGDNNTDKHNNKKRKADSTQKAAKKMKLNATKPGPSPSDEQRAAERGGGEAAAPSRPSPPDRKQNNDIEKTKKLKLKQKAKTKILTSVQNNINATPHKQTDKQKPLKLIKLDKVKNNNNKNKIKQLLTVDNKTVKTQTPVSKNHNVEAKPTVLVNKVKKFNKTNDSIHSPKKVKFVLKNNCMQKPVDYYKSVRQSPSIPFDSSKTPARTNLKPSTPSPINPFFKKKLRLK
ncbi:ribosomal RNA processing protein 1 homolog [Bombyx mandarina]|uniref:Ribosomal RNA processing protein 1 homolog n=1 Tax=Bombyx mandarina TaxID=7092 RepID=A0A6J2K0F8_BOMMA|nr:ribosomal RNA processing protein 1 homolog [Bombyx mandarina]